MPKQVDGTDLVEFSNGVRLHDDAMLKLSRTYSYRRIAEILGVSYIEYNEARALCKDEEFDFEDIPPRARS